GAVRQPAAGHAAVPHLLPQPGWRPGQSGGAGPGRATPRAGLRTGGLQPSGRPGPHAGPVPDRLAAVHPPPGSLDPVAAAADGGPVVRPAQRYNRPHDAPGSYTGTRMTDAALAPAHHASPDRLVVTLFIAAALHAVLILGLGFSLEERDRKDDLPTLEITVVQRPSEPVEEADYLAAASQEGAGNTEERVRPREESQESAPPPPAAAEPEPEQAQLITTREATRPTPQPVEKTPPEPKPRSAAELVDRSM